MIHFIFKHFIRSYYTDYLPILLRAVELWAHDPAITTPVLKLFAELVHCRTQRLAGNVSSPMGILLFREASRLICIYGNRILHLEVSNDQLYPMKLKGISICFLILKNALGGNYVNCGVFKLYGDNTLHNVLDIIAKLILSIRQTDLLVSALQQNEVKFVKKKYTLNRNTQNWPRLTTIY